MIRIKSMVVSLFVSLLFLPAQSFAESNPVYGGKLIVALPAEPPGLDPTTNTAAVIDRVVYNNIFEGLVKINRTGDVVPALAESWEVLKDGKTYIFSLHKGVTFHDGSRFNARDVAFTFKRNMAKDTVNPHPEFFKPIRKVEVVDDYRVKIELKEPNSMFLFNMAKGDSVIVPPEKVDQLKSHPIGTGPFRFERWVHGDHVSMVKYDRYYKKGIPYLDKVIMKFIKDPSAQVAALKAGDIDVIAYVASPESALEFDKDPRFKVLRGTTTADVILSTNNSRKPFNDARVRRAMAHAINRQEVIELAMFGFGTPIGSHMSPTNPNYVDLTWLYPYDPQKARELLAEAGYPNGFEATFKLPEPYSYARRSGEVIADMLSKVGIKLKLEVIEWGQWIARVYKEAEYDLTIIGHAEAFDIGIYARPGYYFRYDSPDFREVLKKAQGESDEDQRKKLYAIAQYILARDAVNGFIFEAPSLPVMKKNVMGWWEDYPIIAVNCTEVYKTK